MKIVVLMIVSGLSLLPCFAQQTVQYSQYVLNQYAMNPAVGGSSECVDVKIGYRQQWVGFSGAPKTLFGSIHAALKSEPYQKGWHGIGALIVNDDAGPYSVKGLYPSYAYHLRVYRDYVAALGFFVGFRQHIYDASQNPVLPGATDPIISTTQSTFVFPDITSGIWIYNNTSFIGFSVNQIYSNKIKFGGTKIGSPSKLKKHFYFTMGKTIDPRFNRHYTFTESLHLKYTVLYPPSIELSMMANYDNTLSYGLAYRHPEGLIGKVQVKFLKFFTVGYAFDLTTSKMRLGSANSHEIIIGISPCPSSGRPLPPDACPAYL